MSKIFNGDEWKRAADESQPTGPTRMQEQHRINELCWQRKISVAEWSQKHDELSNLETWSAKGRRPLKIRA